MGDDSRPFDYQNVAHFFNPLERNVIIGATRKIDLGDVLFWVDIFMRVEPHIERVGSGAI